MPQKYPNVGVAAFIDFHDIPSAIKAHESQHSLDGNELRTNFKAKGAKRYDDSEKSVNDSSFKADRGRQQTQERYVYIMSCSLFHKWAFLCICFYFAHLIFVITN